MESASFRAMVRGLGWFVLTLVWAMVVSTAVVAAVVFPIQEERSTAATAELWDPRTNRWTPAGTHDCYSPGTLWQDASGRIVLQCGAGNLFWNELGAQFTAAPETGNEPTPCGGESLEDGRTAGIDGPLDATSPSVLSVGMPGHCRAITLPAAIDQATLAPLSVDRILVLGSNQQGPTVGIADTARGAFRPLGAPPVELVPSGHSVTFFAAAAFDDGHALVVADERPDGDTTSRPTRFHAVLDLEAGSWRRVAAVGAAESGVKLIPLRNGRVFALIESRNRSAPYVWTAQRAAWSALPALTEQRMQALAIRTRTGKVLVAAGSIDEPRSVISGNLPLKLSGIAVLVLLLVLGVIAVRKWKPPVAALILGILPGLPWAAFWIYLFTYANFGHGRPARRDGKPRLPRLRVRLRGNRANAAAQQAPCDGDIATRAVLALCWAHDARVEQASVTAFEELAADLRSTSAPSELIDRAEHAAREESGHASACAALASRFAGVSIIATRLPASRGAVQCTSSSREELLTTLAIDSVRDGCLGEGFAARAAAEALAKTDDRETRDVLGVIAREESSHAELAWDVLEFCLREGGPQVRDAVLRTLDALSSEPTQRGMPESSATRRLAAHGRLIEANPGALHGAVRAEVVARATRSLNADCGQCEEID